MRISRAEMRALPHGDSAWPRQYDHHTAQVDRAKTMLMAGSGGTMLSCLQSMAAERGVAGLFQGFLATWMRLGPWAFVFFVVYEQLRRVGGRIHRAWAARDRPAP